MKKRWKRTLLVLLVFSLCLCVPFTVQGEAEEADGHGAELSGEDADSGGETWPDETVDRPEAEQSGEDADGHETEQADHYGAECADAGAAEDTVYYAEEELPQYGVAFSCLMGEWRILQLTNKERVRNGLAPMSTSVKLQEACNIRKNEIITKFAHERPDGRHCQTALTDVGISCNTSGENIAAGQTSSAEVVKAWMDSEGHRYNILYPEFTHMGAGYGRDTTSVYGSRYWVQIFYGKCDTTGIALKDMGVLTVEEGTSIDEMDLVLEAYCRHGISFLPVIDEMCSGYRAKGSNGQVQTVTVNYRRRVKEWKD